MTSTALFASPECSLNPHGLKKSRLVVVFNIPTNSYEARTGNEIDGELTFNDLVDESCLQIEVSERDVVSCINNDGIKFVVGGIAKKDGHLKDWNFYSVNWSKDVLIKSELTEQGCIYGIGIN